MSLCLTLLSSAAAEVLKTCDPLISSPSSQLRLVSLLRQHIQCAQLRDEFIQMGAHMHMHKLTHTDTHRRHISSFYPLCKGKPCPIKGLPYSKQTVESVDLLEAAAQSDTKDQL